MNTGVRVIDIFTPLCFGQRIGIFAGSGVGKSTLLAMLASADAFDTVVVALVGERGREVREFLEDTIGHKSMAKTVAVVATSDESAMMRKRAPGTAMRVAEHFRDRGDRVLLVLDSITRFAHALREVATGSGEHPVARGYPASVFTDLPKLLERAGPGRRSAADRSPPSSRCWSTATITTTRSPIRCAASSTAMSCSTARSPSRAAIRRSTRCRRSRGWRRRRGPTSERALVTRLSAMIARFEDTRDIRLLGAYQAGRRCRTRHGRAPGSADLRGAAQSPKDRAVATTRSPISRGI